MLKLTDDEIKLILGLVDTKIKNIHDNFELSPPFGYLELLYSVRSKLDLNEELL